MTNEIQIYNSKVVLDKQLITDQSKVDAFLEEIKDLNNIVFDFSSKEGIDEAKKLKTQANKSVKILKEFCEPFEAEGKKIANIRSKITTTLVTGKDNIIDKILYPVNEAEKKLKYIKETALSFSTIDEINYKLDELEGLKSFDWLAYKEEALKIITLVSKQILLQKLELEKAEEEKRKEEEKRRFEREEQIKNQAKEQVRLRIENELRLKSEAQALLLEKEKREEQQRVNDVKHRRKINDEILQILNNFQDNKSLIVEIARGNVPHLYIKY